MPGFRPAGFTDTLKLAGVVPLLGFTDRQLPPDAAAVNVAADVDVTVTAWACGWFPPLWAAKLSALELIEIVGVLATVRLAEIVCGLLLEVGAVMLIVPL